MNKFLYRVIVVWAGLAAFGARADQVVINEVMYNPRGDSAGMDRAIQYYSYAVRHCRLEIEGRC